LAAAFAGVLAVAGFSGGWLVTAAAGLCVLAIAVGWGDLLRLPHRPGTTLIVAGLGCTSLVVGTFAVAPRTAMARPLTVFAAMIAAAVLLSFAHELARRDGRADVVASVTGTLTGQVVSVLAAGWVLLAYSDAGSSGIVVGASAVAVSRLAGALPLPLPESVLAWLGVGFGVVGAMVAQMFLPDVRVGTAVAVGAAVSCVAVAIDRLFGPTSQTRLDVSVLARAAAPVAAAGTVAYAVIRMGIS
jgi:hypothetical protein